jgi:hypothetical protein
VNSTETPGGSGIPAGWYDDPSGQGLRWWDGEQWTEHVHTAESAAAATGEPVQGEREAPPPQLVRLRERIQARGAKGVGLVLGGLVLVIVIVALLVSGGSDNGTAGTPANGSNLPPAILQKEIKGLHQQLNAKNLPKAEKQALEAELKTLEGEAGTSGGSTGGSGSKNGKSGKQGRSEKGKGKSSKKATPGEEGN